MMTSEVWIINNDVITSYSIHYTKLYDELVNYAYFAANAILVLLVYPLIYIFERLFGFLSDVTLVELSDTNHPILRKLAESAPGTFQHSIQVGNLAQEVAYKINANPARITSYNVCYTKLLRRATTHSHAESPRDVRALRQARASSSLRESPERLPRTDRRDQACPDR